MFDGDRDGGIVSWFVGNVSFGENAADSVGGGGLFLVSPVSVETVGDCELG